MGKYLAAAMRRGIRFYRKLFSPLSGKLNMMITATKNAGTLFVKNGD
jgi:hypothetical protein